MAMQAKTVKAPVPSVTAAASRRSSARARFRGARLQDQQRLIQALFGASPPGFQAPVQRKLVLADNSRHDTLDTLPLAEGKKPSRLIAHLVQDWQRHHLPSPAVDLETVSETRSLKDLKYILGETHGDGTWAQRTTGWNRIATMREGLKGFTPESPQQREAIAESGQEETGRDGGMGLPLEDMHAYAMTRLLMQQQMLNDYDNYKQVAGGRTLIREGFAEIAATLGRYALVGSSWMGKSGQPAGGTRGDHFLRVGLAHFNDPSWALISSVNTQAVAVDALTAIQVKAVQTLLKSSITHLLDLIDTRPKGILFGRKGKDPITNRDTLKSLAAVGGADSDIVGALNAGNVQREAAMIANIKAGPFPLLVQIGTAHVDRVAAGVGLDAVPVPKGTDFDALLTERAPVEVEAPKKPEQRSVLSADPNDYYPGMHDRWA